MDVRFFAQSAQSVIMARSTAFFPGSPPVLTARYIGLETTAMYSNISFLEKGGPLKFATISIADRQARADPCRLHPLVLRPIYRARVVPRVLRAPSQRGETNRYRHDRRCWPQICEVALRASAVHAVLLVSLAFPRQKYNGSNEAQFIASAGSIRCGE